MAEGCEDKILVADDAFQAFRELRGLADGKRSTIRFFDLGSLLIDRGVVLRERVGKEVTVKLRGGDLAPELEAWFQRSTRDGDTWKLEYDRSGDEAGQTVPAWSWTRTVEGGTSGLDALSEGQRALASVRGRVPWASVRPAARVQSEKWKNVLDFTVERWTREGSSEAIVELSTRTDGRRPWAELMQRVAALGLPGAPVEGGKTRWALRGSP